VLISPTEPPQLKALGRVTNRPETFGADVMFRAGGMWCGVQRKEIKDLIGSLDDGRLLKQVAQMQELGRRLFVVEGRLRWTLDGQLADQRFGRGLTKKRYYRLLYTIQEKGVRVVHTDNVAETVEIVGWWRDWCRKEKHTSLGQRSAPVSTWGRRSNKDWACHLVSGIEGVGPELAARIVDQYGVPFQWGIEKGELEKVKGIGKVKAAKIWKALEVETDG
jgi:ERCC4-type nuclease